MKLLSAKDEAFVVEQMKIAITCLEQVDAQFNALAAKYDDALKRIDDMQAELEHLRREVNRG